MPISPENRQRYPEDWEWLRLWVLERAKYRCEFCGAPDRSWGWRDKAGQFFTLNKDALKRAGHRKTPFHIQFTGVNVLRVQEIILTVAHLDHTPENNDPENLKALCGRCHLNHDRRHHIRNRYGPRPGQLFLFQKEQSHG